MNRRSNPSSLRRSLRLPTLLILCLSSWASLAASESRSDPPILRLSTVELERAGIVTTRAGHDSASSRIRVVGVVVRSPDATNQVRSPVEGIVEQLSIAPGTRVARGQLLMMLHSHQVHELSADLRLARRELEIASNRLAAGRVLFELEGISRVELERREQEALRADLAVQTIEVEFEDLGLDRQEIEELTVGSLHGNLPVRAAVSGVVLELHVAPAARIQQWEPLLAIGKPESLELDLQVQPSLAQGILPGDRVRFAPVGKAQCCEAEVLTSVPQVDAATRTVKIRARVDGAYAELLPGMFVEGMLTSGSDVARSTGSTGAVVPEDAVIRIQGRDVVFVEIEPGHYEVRTVELGAYDGRTYGIKSGVTHGQSVVVDGTFLLKSILLRDQNGETAPSEAGIRPSSEVEGSDG